MEREAHELDNPHSRYIALGLGLLFLGKQELADASLEALSIIDHPITEFAKIVLEGCAYACTGNVLKVQKMMHILSEHSEAEKKEEEMTEEEKKEEEKRELTEEEKAAEAKKKNENNPQSAAVLALALIAFGEPIGTEMVMRSMGHLFQYGEPAVKRAVPLAIGLLGLTNPQNNLMDLLGKYSYDQDKDVAINAILAQGLIWSGSNNSRLSGNLRDLSAYYAKDESHLFMTRIA